MFVNRDNVPSTAADDKERLEAERKLQELKRRRNNAESEEFEKMKQKQQDAEAELEELKRKREERRKIMEEEEKQKKQELEDKKAKEQVRMDWRTIFLMESVSECVTIVVFVTGGEEEDEGGDREKEGGGCREEEADGGRVYKTCLCHQSQRLLKGEFWSRGSDILEIFFQRDFSLTARGIWLYRD